MSKEYLEAIDNAKLSEAWITIYHYNDEIIHDMGSEYVENPLKEEIDIVNNALLELKAIKEAKPSEALKWLEKSKNIIIEDNGDFITFDCLKVYSVCEQALIKAQEQEKALKELIKLINDLEQTFNRKGVSSDTDILGTIIKNYFVDNASDLLMRWLG